MRYLGSSEKILKKADAQIGDTIAISNGVFKHVGILMPSHAFSGKDVLTIKLPNGYNVGVKVNEKTKIKVLGKSKKRRRKKRKIPYVKDKPTLSILSTGGTIASYVDYRTGAVYPALKPEELVYAAPELAAQYNLRAKVLYSMFSEDIRMEHWVKLARTVAHEIDKADAVLVPHGTDTMHYTSAALAFTLRNLPAPVVLVGSQRSSDRPSSDAWLNLMQAATLAHTDLGEVVVVMHGSKSDDYALIHRGSKVRKMHSSSRDAFQSINQRPLGEIRGQEVKFYEKYKKRSKGKVQVKERMEEKVAMFYFYPGASPKHFEQLSAKNNGIVLVGSGLGHVSSELVPCIKKTIDQGKHVVMTTQCLYGRVNLRVYSTGRDLMQAGVIPGGDMLPEVAMVKLMWVLGQTRERNEVCSLMKKNLVGELSERTRL